MTTTTDEPLLEVVQRVWAQALEQPVGSEDNFFMLGGTSLLGMRVVNLIRAELDLPEIKLMTLFRNRTPLRFAAAVQALSRSADPAGAVEPTPRRAELVASPLQLERLQYYAECSVRSDAMVGAYDVTGLLDVDRLTSALQTAVDRHDGLQMRLQTAGRPEDLRGRRADLDAVTVWAVTGPDAIAVDQRACHPSDDVEQLLIDFADTPLDLVGSPRVRLLVLTTDAEHHVLALAVDHIVSDPDTLAILYTELSSNYAALAAGEPVPARAAAPSYADYANAQWDLLEAPLGRRKLQFWADTYRPDGVFPTACLPGLQGPEPGATGAAIARHRMLAPDAEQRIAAVARAHETTAFNVLLGAYFAALRARTGRDRVGVVVSLSDRLHPSSEGLAGLVAVAVPIWVDLAGVDRPAELLERVSAASAVTIDNALPMNASGTAAMSGDYGPPGPGYYRPDKRSGGPMLELFVDGLDNPAELTLAGVELVARSVMPPFVLPQGGAMAYASLRAGGSFVALLYPPGMVEDAAADALLEDLVATIDNPATES